MCKKIAAKKTTRLSIASLLSVGHSVLPARAEAAFSLCVH
jgi:hypothetical protein